MNEYITGSISAFILLAMGVASVIAGGYNVYENERSKSGRMMFLATVCVFFWNFGYAWMSMCYDSDFAYVPRAIALLSITFFMFFILKYVGMVTGYPNKKLNIFLVVFWASSLFAWVLIIQKSAVTFTRTYWGYWYYSQMSKARIVQFVSIIAAIIQYYIVLNYGINKTIYERQKLVFKQFKWFGPIMFTGYILDTLLPTFFDIAAVPGSCIGAFFAAMTLFFVSQKNKVFGLSKVNVSQYVFNDVRVPVIITDEIGVILLHNDYASEYINQGREELDGKQIKSFFTDIEGEIVKIAGTEIECKLEKTDVRDKFNSLLYTIFFVWDVTKEQEAYRIAEESRIIAEDANRAKSNFLANMSHEIRTPMNAIIGMSDILCEEKNLSPDTLSKVKDIRNAGTNLLGIVNDILDISKIESGKYELIIDEYEVPSLINDITTIIDARLYETRVKFDLEIDGSIPRILQGDLKRIREILLNVAGNAVKFTKQGSISLKITWNGDKNSPVIYFDISDTGIGIKEEHLKDIFDEFSQVDTRRNRSIQGTGLGLAISKNLAKLMGGDITVESEYEKGSNFHIFIRQGINKYEPVGETNVNALLKRNYGTEVRKNEVDLFKRLGSRVLLVDDTMINLKVASHLLKRYEITVDTATSGAEAIRMVQNTDYDLVFMDHMMPEMDGVEATKHIRELGDKYKDLVIIALTANALSEAKEMFLREGMQDFLAKPIEIKLLDELLNRWLPVK